MAGLKRPLSWLALSAVVAGSVGLAGPAAAQRSTVAVHGGSTAAARPAAARANPANRLGVVKPAMACGQLVTLDLAGMTGVPVSIGSAGTTTATPGGWSACDVIGSIGPQEQFEAFLPTSTWRQLYLQTGCGGFCGAVNISAPQATEKFARLFLMPGMSHCSGGQGPNSFDALTAIINWVEQGAAPKSLLTTQQPSPGNPVRSLPAYLYPLMATYNGTGSVDVASSYHAALPAKPFNAHIHWLSSFSPPSPRQ